jgi:hypothetical protein
MADESVRPRRDHPLRALFLDADAWLEERINGLSPGPDRDATDKQDIAN